MKIYDCFTFYNELDLLEIRLNELNDVVDGFILVEAEQSHQNKSKPLFFQDNKNRYKKFLSKIKHIIVPANLFVNDDAWYNEKLQRNAICAGLFDVHEDDLLVVSDLDEIPSKDSILEVKKQQIAPAVFEQILHYYYLNTPSVQNNSILNYGSVVLKKRDFMLNTEIVRNRVKHSFSIIKNGGWHFSFLGNKENVFNKIKNYAHTEFSDVDESTIDSRLNSMEDPLGRDYCKLILNKNLDYLPEYVKMNLDKFKQYIKN
jgi:beta-1,4-mannosyl-glycoprotein beta-1,4-N-acetylglucosaminyltransferase